MTRVPVILNPIAGGGRLLRQQKRLVDVAAACGAELDIWISESPQHTLELAQRAAADGLALVLDHLDEVHDSRMVEPLEELQLTLEASSHTLARAGPREEALEGDCSTALRAATPQDDALASTGHLFHDLVAADPVTVLWNGAGQSREPGVVGEPARGPGQPQGHPERAGDAARPHPWHHQGVR